MLKQALKRPRVSIGGGQPVFDNDDSSNHSALALADFDENSLSLQNEASTNSSDQQHFPQNQYVPDRTRRPQANVTNNSLNACLDHLWNTLSKKDKEGFFQYPVTDQVRLSLFFKLFIIVSFSASTGLFTNHKQSDGLFNTEKENQSRRIFKYFAVSIRFRINL